MNWFTYTYLTTNEIFEKINYISMDNFLWIFFLIIWVFLIFILNNYIFPSILFWIEYLKREKNKRNRKKLLKKITLQREVEDEIEKSL